MTDHHPFHDSEGDAEPSEQMDPVVSQPKTLPPEAGHATVTHYAYDPQTFEILCRPGQRLTPKKAQRLQEVQLYAHVVASAD